jgi:hypothetical protein
MSAEGTRTPVVPVGSLPSNFLGHEAVGGTQSLRRFPFSVIQDQFDGYSSQIAAVNALIASLSAIGASGKLGYATKSAMDADLAHADGVLAEVSYATDPTHAGTYKKSGASGSGSWAAFSSAVDVLSPDIPKNIYVNANASAGGDGSPANPMNIADLIANFNADTSRRTLEITLKGNTTYRGAPLQFNCDKWREVTIRTEIGKNVDLNASRVISAGAGAFTQPDAVNYPNVWVVDNKRGNISGSTNAPAALIDIDSSQAMGRSGTNRCSSILYTDMGNDQTLAAMNDTACRTGFSLQTTGTYAGKLLVHARSSLDPNTINFHQSMYDYCILFYTTAGTNQNACRVNLSGVRMSYAMAAGFWADRCDLNLENVVAQFNHGYGFQLNQCWGSVNSCDALGNQFDGFNGSGAISGGDTLSRNTRLRFIGSRSLGNTQMLVPLTGAQVVGDGFSNHSSQSWQLIDCLGRSATKDGFSMVDEFSLNNCDADDCVTAGVTVASQNGKSLAAKIRGGRFSGNNYGIQCNAANTGSSAALDVYGAILDTNVTNSIFVSGSKPAVVNAYDVETVGATPSGGHKSNTNTDGASAINVIMLDPLT